MRHLLYSPIFSCLALGICLASCSTTQKAPPKTPKKTATSQKSAKKGPGISQMASQMAQSPQNTTDDVLMWFSRMCSVDTVFTLRDRQYVSALPSSPKSGTLGEASLVVGILRDIMTPPGGIQAFRDVDIKPINPATTDDKGVLPKSSRPQGDIQLSLERRTRERGVDLASALKENNLLKNAAVYTWAWNASLLEGNSEPFRQRLLTVIKSEAALWSEISQKVGGNVLSQSQPVPVTPPMPKPIETDLIATPSPAAASNGNLAPSADPTPTPSEPMPAGALALASTAMGKAQEAAASENFAVAVAEAVKIPEGAPQYAVAQENIRQWSNRAVTDLRKKAAFEYRSASTVNDAKTKKEFLRKAKSYLEDALKSFPQATNLDVVQQNLTMIQAEMNSIN